MPLDMDLIKTMMKSELDYLDSILNDEQLDNETLLFFQGRQMLLLQYISTIEFFIKLNQRKEADAIKQENEEEK